MPADRSPFPLSRWVAEPTLTAVGRRPMSPAAASFADIEAARAGEPSTWVRSLDGDWAFRLRDRVDGVTDADVDPATSTDAWDDVAVPGAWVLQGHGAPIYLNVRMPFAGQAPEVPDANPTGVYRRTFTVPASWRQRRTFLRVGAANSMGFVWVNGRFVGIGTDSHLASTYDVTSRAAAGHQHVAHRRAALERGDMGRGPGPVVDARAAPRCRAGVGPADDARRHGDGAGSRRRRHDRHRLARRRRRRPRPPQASCRRPSRSSVEDPARAHVAGRSPRPAASTCRAGTQPTVPTSTSSATSGRVTAS